MTIARTGRIKEFDLARAFAIFVMVAVHLEFAVYNYENMVFATVFDYLGSPFGAPIFTFILGANVCLSSRNTPKQLFVRGLSLFAGSFLFNVVCHALPFFMLNSVNDRIDYEKNALHWVFAVDILTFAGLAFMFFALVKKLKIGNLPLGIIGVVFSIVNILLVRNFPIDFAQNTLLAIVTGLFYNSSATGYFSFFSWILFPIAGYIFIQIRQKTKNKDKLHLWMALIGLSVYLIMVFGSFRWVPEAPLVIFTDEYSFYQMHPYAASATLAFCFGWIGAFYWLAKVFPKCYDRTVARFNRNITAIYVIQWFLINYLFVLPSNNAFFVNEWQFILCCIGVLILSDLLAALYKRFCAWAKKT